MKILHNGFKQMTEVVLCLKQIRDFGEGRTFPDLPLRGKSRNNLYGLKVAIMKLNPFSAF